MMRDLDAMIDEALGDEERDLLRRIGEEPGFFAQVFGLFGGRTGWVNIILVAVQAAAFIAGVVMAIRFFQAVDPVSQLRWGLPAAVLLLMATMVKLAMMPALEANRVIRELKRIELQIARKGS